MTDISDIETLLDPYGLVILAIGDMPGTDACASNDVYSGTRQMVLAGNAGSAMWGTFSDSPEYHDGRPDPLDRWSRRVGTDVASGLDARVVFPFEGPPWPPVLEWARRTGAVFPSPISMFIHSGYGLWHAYRFALLFDKPLPGVEPAPSRENPCLSCETRPCLSACPVDAFTGKVYRVDDCVAYLSADRDSNCRRTGCAARTACPFAVEFRYGGEHAGFHMAAFLEAQLKTG